MIGGGVWQTWAKPCQSLGKEISHPPRVTKSELKQLYYLNANQRNLKNHSVVIFCLTLSVRSKGLPGPHPTGLIGVGRAGILFRLLHRAPDHPVGQALQHPPQPSPPFLQRVATQPLGGSLGERSVWGGGSHRSHLTRETRNMGGKSGSWR